jgi:hypothetical protein
MAVKLMLAIMIFMAAFSALMACAIGILKITEALMWLFFGD